MRVSIKSDDGFARTVRAYGPDGKLIPGVLAIDVSARVGDVVRATIELLVRDVSTPAEARFIGPSGKAIARIIYRDGTEDVFAEAPDHG